MATTSRADRPRRGQLWTRRSRRSHEDAHPLMAVLAWVVALIAFFPVVISGVAGLRSTDPELGFFALDIVTTQPGISLLPMV